MVDQKSAPSSLRVVFASASSSQQMESSDEDSVEDDGGATTEADGLSVTEEDRELVVHPYVSDTVGVEFAMMGDAMGDEEVGSESLLLLDGVSGSSSLNPSLPLVWDTWPKPEGKQSPLVCEPLARIAPVGFSEFTANYSGDVLALEEAMSLWVEQKYKGFGELMGMPIAGFETECIALLRRIDAKRKKFRHTPGPRKPTRSTKKGTRELQNLISTINYDGKKVASLCH
jgi:hypothetical protein